MSESEINVELCDSSVCMGSAPNVNDPPLHGGDKRLNSLKGMHFKSAAELRHLRRSSRLYDGPTDGLCFRSNPTVLKYRQTACFRSLRRFADVNVAEDEQVVTIA